MEQLLHAPLLAPEQHLLLPGHHHRQLVPPLHQRVLMQEEVEQSWE